MRRLLFSAPLFALACLVLIARDGTTLTTSTAAFGDAREFAFAQGSQAAGISRAIRGKEIRGEALVSLRGRPGTNGLAGIKEVSFHGITRAGIPIAGEGKLMERSYDDEQDVVTFKIRFKGTLGAGDAARPIKGNGRTVVSHFETDYSTDGNDLFMEGIILSFDAEYSGDGNDL